QAPPPVIARQPSQPPAPPPEPIPFSAVPLPGEMEPPPPDLLDTAESPGLSDAEVREKSRIIKETLAQFGLPVEVVEVRRGPTVTQFGVAPGFTERTGPNGKRRPHKVRVSQIAALADDLALALAAPSLRVEAPVPGRSVVGIEVPNEEIGLVTLRSVMESEMFQALSTPLAVALGEDVAGSPVAADLGMMPHLLIAGTTGSGKSVCIKAIATCLAMTNRPDELRMVMIDPKMVELVRFNGLPHLLGHTEVELDRIGRVLRWVAHEMDGRYKKFAATGARHLDDYNYKVGRRDPEKRLPRIVVLIDELADLMMLAPEETERTICRIAQMARATGIHLVVATQRPSTDVVTGLIKANFPARISFATASQVDSRVILDMPGAETLLGRGDMLYLAADAGHPVRVQGCYVSEEEIGRLVDFWRSQTPGWPAEPPWEPMMRGGAEGGAIGGKDEEDDLLEQAVQLLRTRRTISASYLQRRLRVGYPRAARLMEQLEEMGLVGPPEAAGRPRRVIGGESD
ncbi:MAG TPA: DNA translocase FtsK, partial [Anaerolineales bacterium]|nr:DNA translocase FtsK [Anaerolineales bacterium]